MIIWSHSKIQCRKVTGDVTITKKVAEADLVTLLEGTQEVINLEPGKTYTIEKAVITSDKVINGNGATIETTTNGRALDIQATINLTINDVNFKATVGGSAIFTYHGKADNSTVEINGCTFKDYGTSMTLANLASGEIVNCEFDSKNVDISVPGANGEVTIEGNSYTDGLKENIGVGGSEDQMDNVIIEDDDANVRYYPS